MSVTIYHNPDCGTSRNIGRFVKEDGEVVEAANPKE
jgi:arsenate reductase-like glutaredoxin family protein